jgi:hypothetical protein
MALKPRILAATLLAVLPGALAGPQAWAGEPDEHVLSIVVYGDDPCPTSPDGSIVVCARKPESERYRIPKALRKKAETPVVQGWPAMVQTQDAASRAVMPNSCSPIGSNGQTGCTMAMLRQWFAERQLDGKLEPAH